MTINDVQNVLGCPIWARIPSYYNVAVSALNRGIPFVIGEPKSKLSLAIDDISKLLISGADDFDIQKLPPKERKKFLKKYKQSQRRSNI